MIVPSISDMSTRSVESHTNIRAEHAIAPVVERVNVMVLAPGFRFNDFCKNICQVAIERRLRISNAQADLRSASVFWQTSVSL